MEQAKHSRMKELVKILNQASKAYYAENREIMSNFEYDKLYDELEALEANRSGTCRKSNGNSWIRFSKRAA